MKTFKEEVDKMVQAMRKEWGPDDFSSADFHSGGEFYRKLIQEFSEEWCGIDAYDSDRVCDEHTCDNARGLVLSAEDLLEYIKSL